MPTPLASIATTFHTQLFGNVHVNQAHTQLKVPNPSTLQLLHPQQAPQIFSALQSPGMVAMQNHFPAAGSHVIQGVIPSTVNALCSVEQGTVNSSLLQIHAMATNSLCGSMVSFGTGLRQHVQAQPLPLRSATAFPVLLSRSLTLTGGNLLHSGFLHCSCSGAIFCFVEEKRTTLNVQHVNVAGFTATMPQLYWLQQSCFIHVLFSPLFFLYLSTSNCNAFLDILPDMTMPTHTVRHRQLTYDFISTHHRCQVFGFFYLTSILHTFLSPWISLFYTKFPSLFQIMD